MSASAAVRERAYRKLRQELVMGRMVRPEVCEGCGQRPHPGRDGRSLIQGHHHRGYDRPLDVAWLCTSCHREETPKNPPRGERVVTSKLTEDQVRLIRSSSRTANWLARQFGVKAGNIRHVRARRTWAHVE